MIAGVTRGMGVVVALGLAASACTAEGTLVVQVRTDLLPGRELAAVVVDVTGPDGAPRSTRTEAAAARDWGAGVRVAEHAGLAPGSYALDVRALDRNGAVLVGRPVRAELERGVRVVTVLLTRACAGVRCPAEGGDATLTACVGGRCVAAGCTEEDASACGAAACADASACPAVGGACARAECTASGACVPVLDHAACAAGEVCTASRGCAPAECDPARFRDVEELEELVAGTMTTMYGASVPADGLEVVFTDGYDVFRARRATWTAPFSEIEADWDLNLGVTNGEPSISADGLRVVFAADVAGDGINSLYTASRRTRTEPFGAAVPLAYTSTGEPFESGPDLSADELVLVFNAGAEGRVTQTLYLATRDDPTQPFGPPVAISGLTPAGSQHYASLSADALTLYYAAGDDGGPIRIHVARRASRAEPFTGGTVVEGLDDAMAFLHAADPDITFDGTKLYFNLGDATSSRIYVAHLDCAP